MQSRAGNKAFKPWLLLCRDDLGTPTSHKTGQQVA